MTFLPGLTDIGVDGRAVMKDDLSKDVGEISKNKKILVTVFLRNKRTKL